MPASIRPVSAADMAAITAIYAVEVTDLVNTYEYEVPDHAEMTRRMRDITGRGFPYLVAEADGRVAGFAYANTYRSRIAYQWTVENSVYVDAQSQGRGIGRALLGALIDACTARGYRQMVAVIGEPSNTASIALHERFGFTHVGTFQGLGRKHGRWLDTVQMQRALGDGASSAPDNEG
ncbi:MAG: GNAT family N-acetyltransferase [Stenotrophomonas sp.]